MSPHPERRGPRIARMVLDAIVVLFFVLVLPFLGLFLP